MANVKTGLDSGQSTDLVWTWVSVLTRPCDVCDVRQEFYQLFRESPSDK